MDEMTELLTEWAAHMDDPIPCAECGQPLPIDEVVDQCPECGADTMPF